MQQAPYSGHGVEQFVNGAVEMIIGDLGRLVNQMGIRLDADEFEIVDRLTNSLEVRGRVL